MSAMMVKVQCIMEAQRKDISLDIKDHGRLPRGTDIEFENEDE